MRRAPAAQRDRQAAARQPARFALATERDRVSYKTRAVIGADHPSLAGHFPGNPVVPGVVILELVFTALRKVCGPCRITRVPVAKFVMPLLPGQPFTISITPGTEGHAKFSCTIEDKPIALGQLEFNVEPEQA
ncbi:MAG: hydroxymyristoyl-ACP dehydratase [Pseudomonadota bacterium]|nr:MAG: hydroxymyristoyl-ACP dehydratase [Pseudomonadota bacterium]